MKLLVLQGINIRNKRRQIQWQHLAGSAYQISNGLIRTQRL